jgi:predicted restriction endonuclease
LGFLSESKTATIASGAGENDAQGHFQWRLDGVVAEALRELGLANGLSVDKVSADLTNVEDELSFADIGSVTETERRALVTARVGQGMFRAEVVAVWESCAVTGCPMRELLIASHLVPWKLATNAERLDKFNGLLLTPNLDKLLDSCLIAFDDEGSILPSKQLTTRVKTVLAVSERSKLRFVRPAMLPYLQRHRKLFLEKEQPE